MGQSRTSRQIESFQFNPGRVVAGRYEIVNTLGAGWESEVYLVRELRTGAERAAKFFFPHRNVSDKTAKVYAKKLFRLRDCPIVIQYHTFEHMCFRGMDITFLLSEFVDGVILSDFLKNQPGKRLSAFQGLHLLYALATGMECIHSCREYHGDLHEQNIMISRYGLGFGLKVFDFYTRKAPKPDNMKHDIGDMIKIFYDSIGGRKHYAKQPDAVKKICCGLKQTQYLKKFPTVTRLRQHLETMQWF